MKKIISALLILTMLVSMVCVSTSAAGMKIDMKFESMDVFTSQFIAGAFYIDNGILFGYDEARALQSNYEVSEETFQWLTYDSSVTLSVADDDMSENHRVVSLVYCNDNPLEYGRADSRTYMSFVYDIDDGCFRFATGLHGTYGDAEENRIEIMAPIEREIVDTETGEEFFTLGMSVDKDRIRCYYNDELIYDFVDTAREWLISDCATSPFVFWQNGNFLQIKNIKIADAGYLYPYAEEPAVSDTTTTVGGGDIADNTTTKKDEPVESSEATTRIESEVVTDEKGETSIVTKVITEATTTPKAETGKPTAGGSSTSTGDATFVVIAAMVAALGCAVVVKKVNE